MNIGEKLFTYIDVSADLTLEMINKYKNSLIFLGDEQQIFQPLTGSYVGIARSEFDSAVEQLSDQSAALNSLDAHIHQNVVNSIWAEFSSEEYDDVFITSAVPQKKIAGTYMGFGQSYKLMTNQDMVIKGLHDTDGTNKRVNDELGNPYTNTINTKLWSHIDRTASTSNNYKGASGIQVNVHHTGEYKTGTYQGLDYSYWEGHDYLTIDDNLTWAYITSQTSYLMEYSKKVAISQANRIYHDILGGNEPVYIEKEFNEVFKLDDNDQLVPIVDDEVLGQVFVHLKDETSVDGGKWEPVYIHNVDNSGDVYYYVYIPYDDPNSGRVYYIIDTNDPTPTAISGVDDGNGGTITITPMANNAALVNILHPDDGYDKLGDGSFKAIAWYHIDAEATAQGQYNLADGLQTFKEVAYILDKITTGDSDGDLINITYNIAKNGQDVTYLLNWKNTLGDHVVTNFAASSQNKFALVNSYSLNDWSNDKPAIGETRLDIDLLVAQTYTLVIDNNSFTYAAYLNIPSHTNNIVPIWRELGDETNHNYYLNVGDTSVYNSTELAKLVADLTEIYGNSSTQITLYRKSTDANNNINYTIVGYPRIDQLQTYSFDADDCILFNYVKVDYPVVNGKIDALTTVDWVTTYVGWGLNNALNAVTNFTDNTKEEILTYIHDNMTYTDLEAAGQYVSKVDQRDGKIYVTHKVLPLDTILASQEVFGDDFFVPISLNQAEEIVNGNNSNLNQIYYLDGSSYKHPAQLSASDQYYILANANRFTPVDTTSITDPTDPTELLGFTYTLIENAGNLTYFQRIGNKQIVDTTTTKVMKYIPVDINELLSASANNYLDSSIIDELYYYAGTTSSSKYIETSFRKNTSDGSTEMVITSYVTYLGAATASNTGLADAYDVRRTIENMISWVNLKTNKFMN